MQPMVKSFELRLCFCRLPTIFTLMFLLAGDLASANADRLNVVLVMTDDQGYGDLGFHGNEMIQTPHLDQLAQQSARFTNFHVDPTCSETRAALMTGRYASRAGVWHTIMGRSILRSDEKTMADVFAANGYRTGIFGKWHLGDCYPYRPQDRGFGEVLVHGGGGVGQTPDYWGNDYFDDAYFRNGQPEKQAGYCTDVFFRAGMRFIEENQDRPFFCYIPTNAPHGPFRVDEKYSRPYLAQNVPPAMAKFYGMITNIDENMGKLLAKLDALGLREKTLLIFMTDNGTAAGNPRRKAEPEQWPGFNAGMRAQKGSQYDGGHRVPCFVSGPVVASGVGPGEIDVLAAHFDLLPTLIDVCGLQGPPDVRFDGRSLKPLLSGAGAWPERTLLVHSQRIDHPQKWRKSAVMTERWRLIDGQELYEIAKDPGQQQDVAGANPEVVQSLRSHYEAWWDDISERFDEYVAMPLGSAEANPTTLTCHDWHAESVPWHHDQVRRDPASNGFWAVDVKRAGRYEFTLRLRPAGVDYPLEAGTARVQVGDAEAEAPIKAGAAAVTVALDLQPGEARLQTSLREENRGERGAFFVEVKRVR